MAEERRISRKKFLQGAAAAGAGGLVVGGAVGGAVGAAVAGDDDGGAGAGAGGTAQAGEGDPIRIGLALPLTDFLAADGEEAERSMLLAIEEINDAGGIYGRTLEPRTVDIGDTAPDKVRAGYTRLIEQEDVEVIMTNYLFAPGPDMDVVSGAEMLYFHHSALSEYSKMVNDDPDRFWMVWHNVPWETPHGRGMIPVLQELEASGRWEPRNRRIVIITADNSYSTNIATTMRDAISEEGWEVEAFEQIVAPFTEWGPILERIRRIDPDLVFNTDYVVGDIAAFQNQFFDNPTQALMYQQFAPSLPEYRELTGDRSNGVMYATLKGVLPDDFADAFRQRSEERWDVAPGAGTAGIVYDTVYVYADAVRRANGSTDAREVSEKLKETRYRGVCGAHAFRPGYQDTPSYPTEEPDLSLGLPHLYIQIREGNEHEILSPSTYATTEFEPPSWF